MSIGIVGGVGVTEAVGGDDGEHIHTELTGEEGLISIIHTWTGYLLYSVDLRAWVAGSSVVEQSSITLNQQYSQPLEQVACLFCLILPSLPCQSCS